MNTCPGASHELDVKALDHDLIASASILFLEGYLWGPDKPRAAMMVAIKIAHAAGRKVAFTLSESVCIAGRKEGFAQMIDSGGVDLLFANEDEALQLTGRADLESALDELRAKVPTLVITRGRGSMRSNVERISSLRAFNRGSTPRRRRLFRGRIPHRALQVRRTRSLLWTGAIAGAK